MDGKRADDDLRQVATRVPADVWRVLRLAMVAEDAENLQALLRPVIERYAHDLMKEPEIQEALRSLKELHARRSGELERLDAKTRRPRKQGA